MGKLIEIIFRQLPCVGANSLMQVRQTHEIMDAGIGLKIGKVVLGHYFSLVAECRPHVEPVFGDADQCGVFAEDDFRQFGGQIFMYFHFAYRLTDGRGISQRVYGNNFQTIARPLFIEKVVAVIVQEVADAFLSVGILREKVESSIGADSLEKIQFHVAVPGVFINHYVVSEILCNYLVPVFRCKGVEVLFSAEEYVDHGHFALYNRNFP